MADTRGRRRQQLAGLGTLPAILGLGLAWATLWFLVHGALVEVVPARVIGAHEVVEALPVQWSSWWAASWPALAFAAGVVTLEAGLGFALALALPRRGLAAFVALVLLLWPLAVSPAFVVLLQAELAPLVFAPLGLEGDAAAWAAAALVDLWRGTPLVALLVYAASAAPATVTHAAELDGLSAWQRARHVHLPRARVALGAAVALRVVDVLGARTLPAPFGGDLAGRLTQSAWRGGAALEVLATAALALVAGGLAYWLASRGRVEAEA